MAKQYIAPVTLPLGSTSGTPTAGDNTTKIATTAYVVNALSGYVTTASYTAADVLSKLLTVDGASSGLDADLLDGQHGSYYANIPARLGYTPAVGNGNIGTGNFNTAITSGMYRFEVPSANGPGFNYGQLLVIRGASDTIVQVAGDFFGNNLKWRSGNPPDVGGSGSWSAWRTLWHDGNDGSGSGLDADLLDGQHGSYYTDITARLGYTPASLSAANTFLASQTVDVSSGIGDWYINVAGTQRGGIFADATRAVMYGSSSSTLYFRPNGRNSTSGQLTLASNGDLTALGAVFDGSTRRLGYREAVAVDMAGNVTLDDTHSGKTFYNNNGVSYTITLPTGLNAGMMFQVVTYGGGSNVVFSRSGTNLYWIDGSGTNKNANRTLGIYGWATLWTVDGTNWFITGQMLT